MSKISPLSYSALIGLFPYGRDGCYSPRLKYRVILFNVFYFVVSIACRVSRILIFKDLWLNDIFSFFRVFVYLSIQVVQMIFLGCHHYSSFRNKEVFHRLIVASPVNPHFLKVMIIMEVTYSASLIALLVFRCIQLKMYFGIWNTAVIVVLNHIAFQVTLLFSFFAYNIVKRHENLTQHMTQNQDHLSIGTFLDDHHKLMKLFEELNAVFGRSLVFMHADIFISLSFYSYYITTLNVEEEDSFLSYLLNVLLLMSRFTMLFTTSFTAERVMASKILLLYVKSPKIFKFSACGFFTLGNGTVTEMAAAVVTYLVALVQLSNE